MTEKRPDTITCPQCDQKQMKNVISGGAGTIWKTGGHSKAKSDNSQAVRQKTKVSYDKRKLDQFRERQNG